MCVAVIISCFFVVCLFFPPSNRLWLSTRLVLSFRMQKRGHYHTGVCVRIYPRRYNNILPPWCCKSPYKKKLTNCHLFVLFCVIEMIVCVIVFCDIITDIFYQDALNPILYCMYMCIYINKNIFRDHVSSCAGSIQIDLQMRRWWRASRCWAFQEIGPALSLGEYLQNIFSI